MGTVRIFMAPKFDERGLPMQLRDQRLMMIELDKFATTCEYLSMSIFAYEKIKPIINIQLLVSSEERSK